MMQIILGVVMGYVIFLAVFKLIGVGLLFIEQVVIWLKEQSESQRAKQQGYRVPDTKAKPEKQLGLIAAIVLGPMVGIIAGVVFHYWDIAHEVIIFSFLTFSFFFLLSLFNKKSGILFIILFILSWFIVYKMYDNQARNIVNRINNGQISNINQLIDYLGWPNYDVQVSANNALLKIGRPTDDALIAALRNPNPDIRQAAIGLLYLNKATRAIKPLIATLNDPDYMVRDSAASVLFSFKQSTATEYALKTLFQSLKSSNSNERSEAVCNLSLVKDPHVIEPLIHSLKDPDAKVRDMAASTLYRINDPRIVKALIGVALKDPSLNVRSAAMSSLGNLGNPMAVQPLISILKSPDKLLRKSASDALGHIKDPRAVGPLIAELNDREGIVRDSAADALYNFDDPRAKQALRNYKRH
ncbi:MAG: HEAT repeat domain-containing protein [Candidatus Omnitrophica bacterium]|nr:HEAT repeat domain-containing protein [Candidatus Omnitrophota bacterium]MDE2214380.1 HEAT repeat domain-containing protein [Candidatus Omnitrophota bacterium]